MSGAQTRHRSCGIHVLVGEHSHSDEAEAVRHSGAMGRENAGMSSERKVRILPAEYLRFPG
jgi:hypothetical protein